MWIPLACKDSEGSTDKYDRQDAICLSFKFCYGWTPFVCRCARRGAGARNGRAGAGGGDGARKVVLVVTSGGAVGEVLDEALFILLASPPRGGLAASTLSAPAPGLDSRLAMPCAEERIPRCLRRPAKLMKLTLGLQLVCRKQKKIAQSSPVSLHTVAKSLHCYQNVYIRGYKTAEKVYINAEKAYIVAEKVYILAKKGVHFCKKKLNFPQKVYIIYQKNTKKFTKCKFCKPM